VGSERAISDPTSAEYWDAKNTKLGAFQWGNISSEALAKFVHKHTTDYSVPRAKWRVFVAGAGTSRDASALREAMGLRVDQVFAPDVSDEAVRFQTTLGVTSSKVDLLQLQAEFVGQFDIVLDAAFTDVFMSDWTGRSAVKKQVSQSARSALLNLLAYIKPGGFFVEKSMVQNEEEFVLYVNKATRGRLKYAPSSTLGASELRAERSPERRPNAYGRLVFSNFGIDGHVSIWKPLSTRGDPLKKLK
jgi:hypothetical protein